MNAFFSSNQKFIFLSWFCLEIIHISIQVFRKINLHLQVTIWVYRKSKTICHFSTKFREINFFLTTVIWFHERFFMWAHSLNFILIWFRKSGNISWNRFHEIFTKKRMWKFNNFCDFSVKSIPYQRIECKSIKGKNGKVL